MEILFISNNVTDWTNSPATSADNTKFDDTRVPYAITMPNNTVIAMKNLHVAPSGDTVWYHFRAIWDTLMGGASDGNICQIKQSDGTVIAELELQDGEAAAKVYGDSTVTGTRKGPLGTVTIMEFDLKLTVNGSGITMEFYLGQSLQSTANSANTGGLTVGRQLEFTQNDSLQFRMSEFIVAASDTRNTRLDRVNPSTSGNYTAWTGAVADLFDDDEGTSMATPTATNRTSANTDTYSGGNNIAAVVLHSRASAEAAGPQDLTQFLRISATDYDGSAKTLTTSIEGYIENYELDPSDSDAWDVAGVNAVEVGLLAST